MIRELLLVVLSAAAWGVQAAESSATITILEGEALIYRGTGRLHAAEGVRLAAGDIVETGASGFMQIELPDQSVAQFGPATRVMLNVVTVRQKAERWFYVMNGWGKVTGSKANPRVAPGYEVRSRLFEIPANAAVFAFRVTPAEVTLFAERGEVRVSELQSSGPAIAVPLVLGDYYHRKAGARGAVNPGGMQAFLSAMPRFFRDSLPLRIERYRSEEVRAKEAPDFSYADVEVWLKAEPAVRRQFVQRWRPKVREAAFRSALVTNLAAHPEWDPILFPEKYLPKKPAPPRPAASVPAPSAGAVTVPTDK